MLKGLVIRQAFMVVDFALAVAVVGVAYLVIATVFEPNQRDNPTVSGVTGGDDTVVFAKVGRRAQYDGVIQGGLFGKAGQRSKAGEEVPQPVAAPVEKSADDLHLRLWGALAAYPTDPLATAIIENGSFKTTDTYYLGEVVMDQIKLVEVYKRRVILLNQASNERLFLAMEKEEEKAARVKVTAEVSRPRPMAPSRSRDARITVRRQEINELSRDFGTLLAQVNPRPYIDESGKVAGYTGDNLSSVPLASRLGLQDGDVLQTVNGIAIDSEQKVFEIVTKFRDLSMFRVGVLRNGKPHMITFKLE